MYKDEHGNFIGKGEDLVYLYLREIFPEADIKKQYKYKDLMKGEFVGSITERQEKETLDIVILQDIQTPIVVRVQDPHHSGEITSHRDKVQKKTLEWNDCRVVDIQHYNCPNIFKEKDCEASREELREAFKHSSINI